MCVCNHHRANSGFHSTELISQWYRIRPIQLNQATLFTPELHAEALLSEHGNEIVYYRSSLWASPVRVCLCVECARVRLLCARVEICSSGAIRDRLPRFIERVFFLLFRRMCLGNVAMTGLWKFRLSAACKNKALFCFIQSNRFVRILLFICFESTRTRALASVRFSARIRSARK